MIYLYIFLFLFYIIIGFYLIYLKFKNSKFFFERKKILQAAFPELNNQNDFKERSKKIKNYLKLVDRRNILFEKMNFIYRIVIIATYILVMLKIIHATNKNAASLLLWFSLYAGFIFLLMGCFFYLEKKNNQKNDRLLNDYLIQHPENDLKVVPYSIEFSNRFYASKEKIYRLFFLLGITLLIPKILDILIN